MAQAWGRFNLLQQRLLLDDCSRATAKPLLMQSGFLREHGSVAVVMYAAADLTATVIGCLFAYLLHFEAVVLAPSYRTALVLGMLLVLILFPRFSLYGSWRGRSHTDQIRSLTLAWASVLLGLVFIAFTLKATGKFSRLWFGYWGVFGWLMLVCGRSVATTCLWALRRRGWNQRRIAVVGSGQLAIDAIRRVKASPWSGLEVLYAVCVGGRPHTLQVPGVRVKRHVQELEKLVTRASIDEVWICLPLSEQQKIESIRHDLRHVAVTIRFILDVSGIRLIRNPITETLGMPTLNLNVSPMQGMNRFIKEFEDRILALLILIIISPVMLVIAIGVKLSSPGPVFFRQRRVSWNGKEFTMLKFRSMPTNAEAATGPVWAKPDEKRTTAIGEFLRRTSLDELPQFINVLRGDMSIVGPRPERRVFVEQFKDEIPDYMQKHLVKAGITGWAQVNGWRGNTDLRKRIEHDLFYIENWSLWFDIKIIFLTLFKGFVNKNAY